MGNNGFKKEYITGRKDQWDIDYKIMMKGREVSKTIDQYFEFLKENMDFRVLMKKYNKPRVFFYLDPPYISSGKKYKLMFSFRNSKYWSIVFETSRPFIMIL